MYYFFKIFLVHDVNKFGSGFNDMGFPKLLILFIPAYFQFELVLFFMSSSSVHLPIFCRSFIIIV